MKTNTYKVTLTLKPQEFIVSARMQSEAVKEAQERFEKLISLGGFGGVVGFESSVKLIK